MPDKPNNLEITPPEVYFNRRSFMRLGILAASTLVTGYAYRKLNAPGAGGAKAVDLKTNLIQPGDPVFNAPKPWTSFEDITHYNNFYEFTTDKESVATAAASFDTSNWKVSVEGLAGKPKVFDIDDLLKLAPIEQRVYRMRCVEAWSMVIPWNGYSLSKLLERVEPLSSAKYVAFETLFDPSRMPNQSSDRVLDWPYVEGLRIDEAMHPLTTLATGIYGNKMPPQDGAPIRLVVPWKYGFKGIKSIVKITLTDKEPPCTWNKRAPNEYGFYANVNPNVDHPRWSQATEQPIGQSGRQPTLLFNGYADQVGHLYSGMDLRANF